MYVAHLFSWAQHSSGHTLWPPCLWGTSVGICSWNKHDTPPAHRDTKKKRKFTNHRWTHTNPVLVRLVWCIIIHFLIFEDFCSGKMIKHVTFRCGMIHKSQSHSVASDLATGIAVVSSQCEAEVRGTVHAHHHMRNWHQYRSSFTQGHPQLLPCLLGPWRMMFKC